MSVPHQERLVMSNLNDFSQTVRERILYNAEKLGEIKQVLDRDEDPDIIAYNAKMLPTCCVIPVGAGKLTMKLGMGSSDMMEDFQQNVVIYYQQSKDNKVPYSDIDIIREYAKTLMNLFSTNAPFNTSIAAEQQTNINFNGCVITGGTAEFHPYQGKDYTLNRLLLTLTCRSVEI
jgi:hypothetical protein